MQDALSLLNCCVDEGVASQLASFNNLTGKIQDVILEEHLQKEDEVLVSLAGLKQVSTMCVIKIEYMLAFLTCNSVDD